jgi:hypothetical protein
MEYYISALTFISGFAVGYVIGSYVTERANISKKLNNVTEDQYSDL